jgi:hypothetical protein
MNRRYIVIGFLMLILAALACNRTVPTPAAQLATATLVPASATTPSAPVSEATATSPGIEVTLTIPPVDPTSSATPAPDLPTASATASTTPTETPGCTFDSEFVSDITIPDDTELQPGMEFAKTWRMRNSGTCAWEPGTLWSFDSGDHMQGPDSVSVPATQPGDTADITVHLTAPATPGTYSGYWQLREPSGEAFGTKAYVRIIVAGGTGTPTPTATPGTPTPTITGTPDITPGAGPSIAYFRSDVTEADPGDTVTIQWKATDATEAVLYHLMPTGQLGSFWEVSLEGTFEYEIDPKERNHTDFMLFVSDDQAQTVQATLSIKLRCPDTWFFTPAPEGCPAGPAVVSSGAEQHFEHGTMIWVQSQGLIYTLFDDEQSPRWKIYVDEWESGDPESDPSLTPPSGLYQPVRGFGKAWREQPGVRERLGWATDAEAAFTTAVQYTSRPKYNDTYVRALSGGVWRLLPESSGWEKLAATAPGIESLNPRP